mmetsp:Transcript_14116/g.27407  ORF Transcript_14116/g.27407 Transcript_14116/m.27407 type:complete len:427 (-) Transcript_14116:131-1411(-)|eukprot:CAMPEP_0171484786 /NCGR_PEP_ID=MMETSP0958-20121227/193_1 /TAXON_ID=87120 /ORGANISM="Aurantiochytrium limacinum, Strain ATCCMYA-1381" /LENGTH=426 /DNA_ID=CAMNT_0012017523 /DNA_START=39 /DNA_END=1319 /DNA_ORIENTATION=-
MSSAKENNGSTLTQRPAAKKANETKETKVEGEAAVKADNVTPTNAPKPRVARKKRDKTMDYLKLAGALLLMAFTMVVNPMTLGHFGYFVQDCEGKCFVTAEEDNRRCGPTDTTRLIYTRIPKTGSTTVYDILHSLNRRKNFNTVKLGEFDLAVQTVDSKTNAGTAGYNDPNIQRATANRFKFLKDNGEAVVFPPYAGRNRTFFEGHVFHLNWPMALLMPPPFWYKLVPEPILEYLHLEKPSKKVMENTIEFSVVRKPQDRLRSMYYYARLHARSETWRQAYREQFGELEFDECVLDPVCAEKNELRRWCSLQTQFLCGYDKECESPSDAMLETALKNLNDNIFIVGTTERLTDFIELMEKLLPTYFEGATELAKVTNSKQYTDTRRELKFSSEVQAVLDDVCELDNKLYAAVDKLFSERFDECMSP